MHPPSCICRRWALSPQDKKPYRRYSTRIERTDTINMGNEQSSAAGHYMFWLLPAACVTWKRLRNERRRNAAVATIQPDDSTAKDPSNQPQMNISELAPQVQILEPLPVSRPRLESAMSATSTCATPAATAVSNKNSYVLIHNVSHSDVVLDLNSPDMGLPPCTVMARPKFSCFYDLHYSIYDEISQYANMGREVPVVCHPVYEDLGSSGPLPKKTSERPDGDRPHTAAKPAAELYFTHGTGEACHEDNNLYYGAGFSLLDLSYIVSEVGMLRFRGKDIEKLPEENGSKKALISRIYFPLLSILVPKWMDIIKAGPPGDATILLISGQGTPLDPKAEDHANSTYYLSLLMQMFITRVYPGVSVEIVHSGECNLFRYDENIKFVKGVLTPVIEDLRDAMVHTHSDKWKDHFKITVSFADGSSARVSAIHAAMRQYRPSYMHFWQLKSFWHAAKLCQADVESHTFEEIATVPPLSIKDIAPPPPGTHRAGPDRDALVAMVAAEMKAFKKSYESLRPGDDDLRRFWLRKTQKLVMAVLLVVKPDGTRKLYRGTNMEVSMPTGSLCAERNVIGTALSDDLSIRRQDLRMIAVLSVSMSSQLGSPQQSTPLCLPTTAGAAQRPPQFTFEEVPVDIEQPPIASGVPAGGSPERKDAETASGAPSTPPTKMVRVFSDLNTPSPSQRNKHGDKDVLPDLQLPPSEGSRGKSLKRAPPAKLLLPEMPNGESAAPPKTLKKYHSVVVREGDMNPLKPCGACLEWLRKIAEVNPRFSVLTFANAECKAVYVEEVETMIY